MKCFEVNKDQLHRLNLSLKSVQWSKLETHWKHDGHYCRSMFHCWPKSSGYSLNIELMENYFARWNSFIVTLKFIIFLKWTFLVYCALKEFEQLTFCKAHVRPLGFVVLQQEYFEKVKLICRSCKYCERLRWYRL